MESWERVLGRYARQAGRAALYHLSLRSRIPGTLLLILPLLVAPGLARADSSSAPLPVPAPVAASAPAATGIAYQLKADFLYNFATFVDWPDNLGKSLRMCVAVPESAMKYFAVYDGKPVGNKKLVVRHLTPDDSAEDCRILYVADDESDELEDWLSDIQDENVLTVTESDAWLNKGAIVAMQVQGGRVVFDVNLDAARGEEISINSRLLRMARRVQGLGSSDIPGGRHAE